MAITSLARSLEPMIRRNWASATRIRRRGRGIRPRPVQLAREQFQALLGELCIGQRRRSSDPRTDQVGLAVGQQVADISFLVPMAAMDEGVLAGSRPRSTRSASNMRERRVLGAVIPINETYVPSGT